MPILLTTYFFGSGITCWEEEEEEGKGRMHAHAVVDGLEGGETAEGVIVID